MATPANDPNRDLLTRAARLLRPLADELVFVGGCATGLLITDPASGGVRATNDVDAIVEVGSYAKYSALSDRLKALGFRKDAEDVVICRWRLRGWSRSGTVTSARSPPAYFLATKLEAFHGRGGGDFASSHDLEDAITVIDGRPEMVDEVRAAETDVRRCLSAEFQQLLRDRGFTDSLSGFLLPDAGNQARLPLLLGRVKMLAEAVNNP